MKINEVETRVGITKKNIRFYEDQGLLAPRRNAENGYRDYGETEIQILQKIKFLRKLGMPLEEIRQMLNGNHTVGDGMRRHAISLEREKKNVEESLEMCQRLQQKEILLENLDINEFLLQMEEMEKGGTLFQNKQKQDVRKLYTAPIAVTVVMVILMIGLSMLLFWAYETAPEESPPMLMLWLLVGIFITIGGGVVLALMQRIQEIGKGEMNDAKYY